MRRIKGNGSDRFLFCCPENCCFCFVLLQNLVASGDSFTLTVSGGSGTGVRNVHQRIRLTFGAGYGLTIFSEPDEGTLVRIRLPALTREEADRAYLILKRMLNQGADIHGVDSYGNSCVWRVCLQARQVLPAYNHTTRTVETDRILTPELKEDLTRIFTLLRDRGMDLDYTKPGDSITVRGLYKNEPIAQFLIFN